MSEWMTAFWLRIQSLLHRRQLDRDLEDELEFHLAMREQKLADQGTPAEEAHYAARRELGNVTRTKEMSREMWTFAFLETLWQDLRFGLRQLRRNPGFTAVAIITMALAIAANTTIFSAVSLMLLKKPPVKDPDRLMVVVSANKAKGWNLLGVSVPNFESFQKQNHVFDDMAAAYAGRDFTLTGEGPPEHLTGMEVTANYFTVLGLSPARGRSFIPSENQAGRNRVVILSHGLWKQRFAANPNVIGKQAEINGEPYTIIGVMRPGTDTTAFRPQLWTPIVFSRKEFSASAHNSRYLFVFARLRSGVTMRQAQAQITAIAGRIARSQPETEKGWSAQVLSLQGYLIERSNVRAAVLVLMGAVLFVLLIACANVAGLLLARAASRQHEMAIRTALGAGRLRVIRQLLAESLLIALGGGGLGLLLAYWGIDLLRLGFDFNSYGAALASGLHLDGRTLAFTVAITLGATFLFGLMPAFRASKPGPIGDLKEGGRTGAGGLARSKMRSALVIAEIALALVLLEGAGLFIQFFVSEVRQNPGFNSTHIVTAGISLSSARYKDSPAKQAAFFEDLINQLRNLPGVESASAAQAVPLGGSWQRTVGIKGKPKSAWRLADIYLVGPEYFRTMEIPLMKGRIFLRMDDAKAPRVALVNRAFARKYFPKGGAIGHQVLVYAPHMKWAEVVGIVGNVKAYPGQRSDDPQVYEPYLQQPSAYMTLVVRTRYAPAALAPELRRAVWSVDKDQPVGPIMTMQRIAQANTGGDQLMSELMAIFAGMALLLSIVGIYGVIAFSVVRRTHEIGIRMALGAQKSDVLRLVLRQGGLLTLIGCAIGLALAFPLPELFSALFNGFPNIGHLPLIGIAGIVALASMLAAYIPARRAMKIDPMEALRYE